MSWTDVLNRGVVVPAPRGVRNELPRPLVVVRILLYVLLGATALGGIGFFISAYSADALTAPVFGTLLYGLAPGVVGWLLGRQLREGGTRVWGGLIAVQVWLVVSALINLSGGSWRGTTQLLIPAAILHLVLRSESRAWFRRVRTHAEPSAGDRGQSAVEYTGLVVLVSLIILAMVTGGVGGQVANGLESTVCRVMGSACASGTGDTAGPPTGEAGPQGGAGGTAGGGTGGAGEDDDDDEGIGGTGTTSGTSGGDTGGSTGDTSGGNTGGAVGGSTGGTGTTGEASGGSTGGAVGGIGGAVAGGSTGGTAGGSSGGAAGGSTGGAVGGTSSSGGATGGSTGGAAGGTGGAVAGGSTGGTSGSQSGEDEDQDDDDPDEPTPDASCEAAAPAGTGGGLPHVVPASYHANDFGISTLAAGCDDGTEGDDGSKEPPNGGQPEPEGSPDTNPAQEAGGTIVPGFDPASQQLIPAPEGATEQAQIPVPEGQGEQALIPVPVPVPVPKSNPHPEVAVTDVDTSGLPDTVKWRDTDEPLYRFDDRPPSDIFVDDFAPKDPKNTDLYDYVKNNNKDSGFVSTTTTADPVPFYGQDHRYEIDAPGGVDVNGTFGGNSPHPNENEVAFPGGIDSKYIKGAWTLQPDGSWGDYVENPYYESPEERGEG